MDPGPLAISGFVKFLGIAPAKGPAKSVESTWTSSLLDDAGIIL